MSLRAYKKKRRFDETPEPEGRTTAKKAAPGATFVVQKHTARRLHYDFRLELDGVLKSWAVPKGPSMTPNERRLAVHVEDHPLEYAGFEGTIPKGHYGAGTVKRWDFGTWEPIGNARSGYKKGHFKFALHGTKLRGNWALVRMKNEESREHDNWLLIHEGSAKREKPKPSTVRSGKNKARSSIAGTFIAPALATLVEHAPSGDDWLFELKFDGYRASCVIEGGRARVLTRRGHDWTEKFSSIAEEATTLAAETAVLDREIVALSEDGTTSFQKLQNSLQHPSQTALAYYAFDLLHLNGQDLRAIPLEHRKDLLKTLLDTSASLRSIRFSDHVVGNGSEFFRTACERGLEGIVAKRRSSPYRSTRTTDWLKIKCGARQEFVIGGFTDPAGGRKGLGALLLGVFDADTLKYAGRVGTGFDERLLVELRTRLGPLERKQPAFSNPPRGAAARGVHWVAPKLVGEVKFAQWTDDGVLRHPSFVALREDKPAREVVRETARRVAANAPFSDGASKKGKHVNEKRAASTAPSVLGVTLTHPDKVLYPKQSVTKLELARYFEAVAEFMMPHVQHRVLTLVRCPNGEGKSCFFQKHPRLDVSDGLTVVAVESSGKGGTDEDAYVAIEAPSGLISLVQMGVLEIHLWGSQTDDLEHPDRVVFDIDPDESLPWDRVVRAARTLRMFLGELGLESFVKTTGGKGLHVVTPIRRTLVWDEVKGFSKAVAEHLAKVAPDEFVSTMSKSRRAGKIFIDYLRNGRGATAVAPYATRAGRDAPVATPVDWDELEDLARPTSFTVRTVPERMAKLGADPWAAMLSTRQTITRKTLSRLGLK